jgi:hypothetical protein
LLQRKQQVLRRRWIGSLTILASLAWPQLRAVLGQEGHSLNSANRLQGSRNVVPLIDQLVNGLRATRNSEVEFLQVVVDRVEQGKLPQGMVNLVYRWAIQRNPRVPFPYFQLAMRELSRRRGIILP